VNNFKLVATADNHVGLFKNISLLREDMLTDRIEEIGATFKQTVDDCVAEGIKYLFILGDMNHNRNIREDSINNYIKTLLLYAKEKGIIVYLLVGNHDQANINGTVHAFENMKDICNVIDKPCIIPISGFDCYFLTYEEYRGSIKSLELLLKQGKNSNRLLFAHVGIENAFLSGFDHVSKEPVTLGELQVDKFLGSYLGHYHLPQCLDEKNSVYYIGSPCQHSLVDKPADRGYMIVELELVNGQWKTNNQRVTLDSPKFIEVEAKNYNPNDYQGKNYIKVTGVTRKDIERLEKDENVYATTGERKEQVVDEDKVIQANLSWELMVDKYVEITCNKKRQHNRLKKLGKELINV